MLPIAASIVQYGGDSLNFLVRHSADEFRLMLSKWLTYFPNFQDKFSRELSKRALTIILQHSSKDISFAGLSL